MMIEINGVLIVPSEIASVEPHIVKDYDSPSISDCSMHKTFDGVKIILKNGRKIYIDKTTVKEINILIEKSKGKNNGTKRNK